MGNLKLSPRNWQKIKNKKIWAKAFPGTPTKFQPIEPFIFTLDTPLCLVLMSNPVARYNWWLAGYVKAYLYSGAFVSRQIIGTQQSWRIGLDRPELINFRHYNTTNRKYALEINTRSWHRQMNIQVWKYKGQIIDAVDEYQQENREILEQIRITTQNISDYSL